MDKFVVNELSELDTPQKRLEYIIRAYFQGDNKLFAESFEFGSVQSVYKYIGKNKIKMSKDRFEQYFVKYGLNFNWYRNGIGSVEIPVVNNQHIGVPFYNIDATATIVSSFDDITEEPEYYINFKPLNDCTAYFTVYGDSMYPRFQSGDIVAIKQITNLDAILWGEPYLIITNADCNNYRTIKTVHQHSSDDNIVLKASNPNYVGETIIKKEHIIGMFMIKGKFTRLNS